MKEKMFIVLINLLKIFNCSETIKDKMNENLSNLPKNLLRTSSYLTHPVF
jgi:glycine dehydrogenase